MAPKNAIDDPAILDTITRLVAHSVGTDGDQRAAPLVRSMIETCLALGGDRTDVPDLKLVDGISAAMAETIHAFFHGER